MGSVPSTISGFYTALDRQRREIRVFRISSDSTESAPLQCTLRTVSLLDPPAYEAISYVWGDPSITETLTVDRVDLKVPANLSGALRLFRKRDLSQGPWLWADAVCIDQSNISERAQQVSLMRDVFTQAHNVRCWLGSEPSDTAAIAKVARAMVILKWYHALDYDIFTSQWGSYRHSDYLNSADAEAVEFLMTRAFWRRTW